MMNLQEFISETLFQITEGVRLAQERTQSSGAMINAKDYVIQPSGQLQWGDFDRTTNIGQTVEFDVAVTVGDSENMKGGMGITAGIITVGYKADKGKDNNTVSRIKFSVPVFLPQQKVTNKSGR